MSRTRFYPMPCRSLYCGETTCPETCPHQQELQAFQQWRQQTNAYQPDPIWCPTAWTEA